MDATQLSDHDLLYQMLRHDILRGEDEIMDFDKVQLADSLNDEFANRFGPDANDLLATYFTASHASSEDMIRDAQEMPQVLIEIAKDTHVHQHSQRRNGNCLCGVQAQFIQ